jgi:hypothetical protein
MTPITTAPATAASATSAQAIIDCAPLGAIIRFSDGTPQPPARFKRKLSDWQSRNGCGRLVERSPACATRRGTFALHLGDFGDRGVVILSYRKLYSADSRSIFTVESVPQPGEALVLTTSMGGDELQHLAENEAAARTWLEAHRHPGARIEIVGEPADRAAAA